MLVAPAADSIRQLLDQPQAKRLLAIARSDNPVIALGVTRREQSWTYAMGWLLDPDRDPKVTSAYATAMIRMLRSGAERAVDRLGDDTEASRHLSGLIRLDPNAPIRVEAVATELPLGRAGRVDVVLRCRSGGMPVTVLIENKIDTRERVDQLGGYVRAQGSQLIEGELLAPLLIELGDTPKSLSSCPWAMCWGRAETKEWLHAVQPQPGVARAYAEVFEAWELGRALSSAHTDVVAKTLSDEEPGHAELRLIRPWLSPPDVTLYRNIAEDRGLGDLLDRLGFQRPSTAPRLLDAHGFLQFTKPGWTLKDPVAETASGINTHYELRGPGRFQLHVEVDPYEGSLARKPAWLRELAPLLPIRAELHHRLREGLRRADDLPDGLRVSLRGARKAKDKAANLCVAFTGDLDPSSSGPKHARFITAAIGATEPLIEREIGEIAKDLGLYRVDSK